MIQIEETTMFDLIYNQIYYIGIQAIRYGKRFFRWLGSMLLKPIKFIGTLIFTLIIVVDKMLLKVFHESVDDFRELVADIKRVMSDFQEKKAALPNVFPRYRLLVIYQSLIILISISKNT